MNTRHAGLLLVATAIALGGCSERKLRPLNPCTVTGVVREVSAADVENVDLLFIVDDSGSMAEEQQALQARFPEMVEALLTGHLDDDGVQDFPPVKSLRVGVISTDMGVLGMGIVPTALDPGTTTNAINTCGNTGSGVDAEQAFFGDDGVIKLVRGAGADAGSCPATIPDFLQFTQSEEEPSTPAEREEFADQVACTALLGTGGCGFEMQLEAILTAITDSDTHPVAFAPTTADGAPRNRRGQRSDGMPNREFFREDSVIVLILVTDEEDCSTNNPELFMFSDQHTALQDPQFPNVRVNTRCFFFDEELYPINRYVQGIRNLRPEQPNRIIFGAIVGVPEVSTDTSFTDLLAHPNMQYQDRLSEMGQLLDNQQQVFMQPACFRCAGNPDVTDFEDCPNPQMNLQWAAPGRRYVQLAQQLEEAGMNAVVRSICAEDFRPALASITQRIADVLKGACLPRELNPDSEGRVNCDVVEILPPGVTCASRVDAGREATPVRLESNGTREVCRINQLVPTDRSPNADPPPGTGWFYDTFTSTLLEECTTEGQRQRIAFTEDAQPAPGADIRLECLQPVQGGGLDGPDIFQPCTSNNECAWANGEQAGQFIIRYNLDRDRFLDVNGNITGQALFCEPSSNTCQIACDTAAECPGGFVCANPGTDTICSGGDDCICVNPTCSLDSSAGGGGSGGGGGGGGGSPDAGP